LVLSVTHQLEIVANHLVEYTNIVVSNNYYQIITDFQVFLFILHTLMLIGEWTDWEKSCSVKGLGVDAKFSISGSGSEGFRWWQRPAKAK
jgi:hypothetical protein